MSVFQLKLTDYDDNHNAEVEELLLQGLEKKSLLGWSLYKYKGHWCSLDLLRPIIRCEKYFKARDTDVILATLPKSGTTWLKALTFSIINRSQYPLDENPLLTSNPHALIPFLERNIYRESENPDLDHIPDPRIFSTHVHYKLLPISIMESKCRVIHICRNPLDQFISLWHFKNLISTSGSISLDEFLEAYCEGTHDYGPFWEHVLGYWNAYLKNPEKVLFLKYEDLKKDVNFNVKIIAEFIGYPFSFEEEKMGLIDKIVKLCSFEKLKNLEVNQVGSLDSSLKNSYFFRNGEIGDWVNYLTPAMVERLEKVVREEFRGSGLML
ncbi:cytosolic sulfotransferase 8-like [Primulina tabacum]|uniref:cytosolic sulfotransferase 8-like n=1 Tax=Primulina tabacum TaxID=48773 RepID=UPI003F59893D